MSRNSERCWFWVAIPLVVILLYVLGGVLWVYDLASWDGWLGSHFPPAVIDVIEAIYAPVLRRIFRA